jgi:eukaryotic-like serine/threonine-protein kinase
MIGQTISHYKILEKLGEGGMGVVYKAQDTKLDRFVALKFLPPHVAASSDDKARFLQEAKAVASLAHPNICTIHSVEEEDGKAFIVMEYVEGKTLKEMDQKIPLKQAVEIGTQIADGLAAAHEKGIVHRDIKPDNIMIRKDGRVQIMDFGLAKLRGVSRLTKEGTTVGTAGYMSPEQVQGLETDHRTDIFSLGVVLYEMFAGESPFKGIHETAITYEIVNVDPLPLSTVKPDMDPQLDSIVLECLAKEPSERSQSIAEVAKDLRRYKRESSRQHLSRSFPAKSVIRQTTITTDVVAGSGGHVRTFLPWGIAAILFVATFFLLFRQFLTPTTTHPLLISSLLLPDSVYIHSYGQAAGPPVISADGRNIAFVGVTSNGFTQIYVRSLKENIAHPLDGTRNAQYPFWSPDGKYVGFFAGAKIKKIEAGGGSPVTVCAAVNPRGATWSSSGVILFAPEFQSPIYRVSSEGGIPVPVTKFDTTRNESSHRWPFALPDGKHFLYFSRVSSTAGQAEGHAVYGATLDGKENVLILRTSSNAIYASGYLLFVRGSTLMAQQFDESSLRLKGDPTPVAEEVMDDPSFNLSVFSASETGILIYQSGHVGSGAKLLMIDRNGKSISTLGEKIEHFRPRYSPDGQHILAGIFDPKLLRLNVWKYDLRTGGRDRITSGTGEYFPIWSPDGSRMIFSSQRGGPWNMYQTSLEKKGAEESLRPSPNQDWALDWSHDGSSVLFSSTEPSKTRADLWILQMNDHHDQYPLVNTDFDESDGCFSPDGKWIAYVSDESGEYEIYIRSAKRNDTQKWKVSAGGGAAPRWAGSSSDLCYVSSENKMMLVTLQYKANIIEVASRHSLFTVPAFLESYDVSPNGKTLVINRFLDTQKSIPLTMMVHWDEELKRK